MFWWQWWLVLVLCANQIKSQNYDIIVEKIECKNLANDICQNATCHIRPIKRLLTNISMECHLTDEIDSLLLRIKLNYKVTEYRKFLVDVEENYCDFAVDNKRTIVMNLLASEIVAKSNINKTCPIKKGHLWIRNYQIDARATPPFLPNGQYRLDIHATNKEKTKVYLSPKVYVSIRSRGLNKGEMG